MTGGHEKAFVEVRVESSGSGYHLCYELGSRAASVTAHQPAEHLGNRLTKPFSRSPCSKDVTEI